MNILIEHWKIILAILATIIALYSYVRYITSIFQGKTKPHVLSWSIWALTTGIAFFAQVSGGGGWGSAQNGVTFIVCIFIALCALKYGSIGKWGKLDWMSLGLSMFAIILWIKTNNPFYGSIFAMLADLIGYIPTFKKVWHNPETEPSDYYMLMNVKHGLSLVSLSVYSWTTMIFSASIIIINFFLIMTIRLRKN